MHTIMHCTINYYLGETPICDLNSLLHTLQRQISSKWYSFGLALGVPKEMLNQLKDYSDEECLVEVLDYWLKHHQTSPTWKEVMEAKMRVTMNEPQYRCQEL